MYSYHHIRNRDEFIKQFKQDHGIPVLNNNNINKSTILQKSKSRGDLLNKSPSHVKKKDEEGRWDYLYKLEKLKRIKLDEKRRMKDMNEYKRDVDECTFSPKLNSSKMIRINSGLSNMSNSSNNLSNISMSIQKSQIMKKNSNGNNSISLIEGGNLIDRHKAWEYKKNMKIENIKQSKFEKDNNECIFSPKLNPPDKLRKIQINQKSDMLVCDPQSFSNYINRQNKYRNEIESDQIREKSLPGSGNIWTNKITKPKEFNLFTESNGLNRSCQKIKSLSKPVVLNKFNNVKTNYKVGVGRFERSNNVRIEELVYSPKKINKFNEQKNQNEIMIENKFGFVDALKNLHEELHSIDLKGRQIINLDTDECFI